MKIDKKNFGVLSSGKKVSLYTLKAGDLRFSLTDFGAAWTSLVVPSRKGQKHDVLLGYADLGGFVNNAAFFGVTVGRHANRIGGARFTLNGKEYLLEKNDGENNLHSGRKGFARRLWKAEAYEENGGVFVRFELESPDGDQGFPGNLRAAASYGINKSNELTAVYEAKLDAPCPVNLTNHAYFNLAGEGSGDILSHEICIHASAYVETDGEHIPTGRIVPVKDSPYDFRVRRPVRQNPVSAPGGPDVPEGYDHCYVLEGEAGKLRPCAEVFEPLSGRRMKVFTTQPGVQFYTGNMLSGINGKQGSLYLKHSGFCLETEYFPDSPNNPAFPSCIFGQGKDFYEKTVFAFNW
ncbi:MAG: galactose mutarotase [Treponema sp.]|nr:galactose mutarotase [Treponema sp.]